MKPSTVTVIVGVWVLVLVSSLLASCSGGAASPSDGWARDALSGDASRDTSGDASGDPAVDRWSAVDLATGTDAPDGDTTAGRSDDAPSEAEVGSCARSADCGTSGWCNPAGGVCVARQAPPIHSFVKDILPFVQSNGCLACHGPGAVGAIAGTAGVPLVLTGTPWEAYQALSAGGLDCGDGKARRLCVSEPRLSLLTQRLLVLPGQTIPHDTTAAVFHGWGEPELQMLLAWVAAGAVFDGTVTTTDGGAPEAPPCTPACAGKCAGSNGCGGTCMNSCAAPLTCGGSGAADVCGCTPACAGKCGGSDGCGGTCVNNCAAPLTCGGGGTVNVCGGPCVAEVAPGVHTCARKLDGTAWCWGRSAFGDPNATTFSTKPAQITALGNTVAQVASGRNHSCARKQDGTIWCWGQDNVGQLGDGGSATQTSPVQVTALGTAAVDLAAGGSNTCARKQDGSLWCWGSNYAGFLGNASGDWSATPVQIPGLGAVAAVSMNAYHICARLQEGSLQCWGYNRKGQIGDKNGMLGTFYRSPFQVDIGGAVLDVVAGSDHTCAVRQDGAVYCWGNDDYGELGDGRLDADNPRLAPWPVPALTSSVARVAAGAAHSCALKSDHSVSCWGEYGYLGDGNHAPNLPSDPQGSGAPVATTSLGTTVSSVVSQSLVTCAVKSDNSLWCWGYGGDGAIGDGAKVSRNSPVSIPLTCDRASGDVVAPSGSAITSLVAQSCRVVHVAWEAGSDDATPPAQLRYDICYSRTAMDCRNGAASAPHLIVTGGATSADVSGLDPGTRYYFLVRAVDAAGNKAPPSAESPVDTQTGANVTLPVPGALTASRPPSAPSTVVLTWQAPANDCVTYEACSGGVACATWTPVGNPGATSGTLGGQLVCSDVTIGLRARSVSGPGTAATVTVPKQVCFDRVAPIIRSCNSGCHKHSDPPSTIPVGNPPVPYVAVELPTTYADLVRGTATYCPNSHYVVPGDAEHSYLSQSYSRGGCKYTTKMGFDDAEKNAIERWINGGAFNADP